MGQHSDCGVYDECRPRNRAVRQNELLCWLNHLNGSGLTVNCFSSFSIHVVWWMAC